MINYVRNYLTNISKTPLRNVKGIVLHLSPDLNAKTQSWFYSTLQEKNNEEEDFGYHYSVMHDSIVATVNDIYQINSIKKNTPTYISNAICDGKVKESFISIHIGYDGIDYLKLEELLIKLLVDILRQFKLTANDVWRGFDLSKDNYEPIHLLDKDIFSSYIKILDKYMEATDYSASISDQEAKDAEITYVSPFTSKALSAGVKIDEYVTSLIKDNIGKSADYSKKFTVWDKGIDYIKEFSANSQSGTIENSVLPTKNNLQYKITQKPTKDLCDCEKPTEFLEGVNTASETMVEPIYPDLITPPGGEIHIANGSSESAVQNSSSTPLNIEEFEKRQKTFSLDNFSLVKKQTSGRPANPDDEFPVDQQIKKLEEHYPKVKIDKTTFNFIDDNHLGSEIGQAMAKNYNMSYDMITEVAKRTEQRLVKIENNLATVMRNLFRMSSRVNINCVYYGGQSVYGKYKCIRCLHDNRLHDGAVVSLDQCLSCTRYEPIAGQVYAILDETGSNVVKTIDDIQLAYMSIDDYKDLNSIERMPDPKDYADLTDNPSKPPRSFSEGKWKDTKKELDNKADSENNKNGFAMDWNPVMLETQKPHINEYSIENEELNKNDENLSSDLQEVDRTLFVDTRRSAIENEPFEFDIADYAINNYSTSSTSFSSGGSFGMGAADIRQKIVDYSLAAVKLCEEGKAQYSQANRYAHGNDAINGMSYWDCSSLVQRAYEAAGISGIGTYTANQYPYCLDINGGILIPIKNVSEALPGDMVWFKEPPIPTTKEELQKVDYQDTNYLHHIGIYIGDNKYAHAAYHNESNPRADIKVSTLGFYDHELAFGRVAALIKADKEASQGVAGAGAWNKDSHGISNELWNMAAVADSNVNGLIANMNEYKYKDILNKVAKEKGFDPYFIAAIMAVESNGNPLSGGAYPGIMQSSSGYATKTLDGIADNIRLGCESLKKDAEWLTGFGWKSTNVHLLASAHNCGRYGTTDALGHSNETQPSRQKPLLGKVVDLAACTIGEVSKYLKDYTSTYQPTWDVQEKQTYAVKVLRAYNNLLSKKVLENI